MNKLILGGREIDKRRSYQRLFGGSIRLDPNQYGQLDSIQISPPLMNSKSLEQTGAFGR
jgi:hypothetical protein